MNNKQYDHDNIEHATDRTMISAKIKTHILDEVKKDGIATTRIIETGLNYYLSLGPKERRFWLVAYTPELSLGLSPLEVQDISELPDEEFRSFFNEAFAGVSKAVTSFVNGSVAAGVKFGFGVPLSQFSKGVLSKLIDSLKLRSK